MADEPPRGPDAAPPTLYSCSDETMSSRMSMLACACASEFDESAARREERKEDASQGLVVPELPHVAAAFDSAVFAREGIPTNVTLCFSLNQALLAAKAGASFISPFVGRIEDAGGDGIGLLERIREVYDTYGFTTQILAASLRSPAHVEAAALAGCDAATLPAKVFDQLPAHPLTETGLAAFLSDWKKTGKSGLS